MGPGGMRELWGFTRGSQDATAGRDEVAIEGADMDEQASRATVKCARQGIHGGQVNINGDGGSMDR